MRRALTLLATVGLTTAAIAWQQTVNQLQHDGKTISTNLRVVDGTLMAPVKDIAAYLGGNLKVENGTATITAKEASKMEGGTPLANGANPINAPFQGAAAQPFTTERKRPDPIEREAKLGTGVEVDTFTFTVQAVDEVPKGSYWTQYDPRHRKISPPLKDERLVVVRMRLENASNETKRPLLPTVRDVTVFDQNGVGSPVMAFDVRPVQTLGTTEDLGYSGIVDSPLLAPKGAFEFAAVFSLPKDRSAKSIVVALPPNTRESGGTNIHIDL